MLLASAVANYFGQFVSNRSSEGWYISTTKNCFVPAVKTLPVCVCSIHSSVIKALAQCAIYIASSGRRWELLDYVMVMQTVLCTIRP